MRQARGVKINVLGPRGAAKSTLGAIGEMAALDSRAAAFSCSRRKKCPTGNWESVAMTPDPRHLPDPST